MFNKRRPLEKNAILFLEKFMQLRERHQTIYLSQGFHQNKVKSFLSQSSFLTLLWLLLGEPYSQE